MFSAEEKATIASAIEKVLIEIAHPEMPKEKVKFNLHVEGKESWSWANIVGNWEHKEMGKENPNSWNEVARKVLTKQEEEKK